MLYIHSGYLYSAPSRNLLRRNLQHVNWYRRLGSLAIPCDPGTITESSGISSKICLRNASLIECYTNDQDFLRSGQLNSLLLLLNLGPTLAPLTFSLDTQQPRLFPNFSRCSTSLSDIIHLYCERSFIKLKIILSYIRAVSDTIDSVIWPYHLVIREQ